MKINLKELFFWIFLVLSMSLLLWNVFGNSPSEFIIMAGIIFMLVLKIWSINDRQIVVEMKVKEGFNKMKGDLDLIKKKLKI